MGGLLGEKRELQPSSMPNTEVKWATRGGKQPPVYPILKCMATEKRHQNYAEVGIWHSSFPCHAPGTTLIQVISFFVWAIPESNGMERQSYMSAIC